MFRKIDYGTGKKFEPIPVVRIKSQRRKYNEWDVIVGKSMLKEEKKFYENGTILELMKSMKRTNKSI